MVATIEFPRKGVDGILRTKKELEGWWNDAFSKAIIKRLGKLKLQHEIQSSFIDTLIEKINQGLLTLEPEGFGKVISELSEKKVALPKDFKKKIENAFGYDGYREKKLVEWSEKLNVKVCPYCNHEYTLYVGSGAKKALHQFDHFYSKSKYPFLSMSMYNLIPSCSICNHEKSVKSLNLTINPYCNDISDKYSFHVSNSYALRSGRVPNDESDHIEIELRSKNGCEQDVTEIEQNFLLSKRYGRHKDMVSEIYNKVYCEKYYENLPIIPVNLRSRLLYEWMNVPLPREDIEKNPLTKFRQDILRQAREEYLK